MSEYLYDIGDIVVIVGSQKGLRDMADLIGKTETIIERRKGFFHETGETNTYLLENGYLWAEEWLAPPTEIDITENDLASIFIGD